jgi:hypothetical protein
MNNAYTNVVTGRVTGVKGQTIFVQSGDQNGSFTVEPLPPCRVDDHVCVVLYREKILAISNFSTASAESYRVMAPDGPYKKDVINKRSLIIAVALLSVISALQAYVTQISARTELWHVSCVLFVICACVFIWILASLNDNSIAWNSKIDAEIQRAIVTAAANTAIWETL